MIDFDDIDEYTYDEQRQRYWVVVDWVEEKLDKIRMGVYDESRHGDLRETLEELERLL